MENIPPGLELHKVMIFPHNLSKYIRKCFPTQHYYYKYLIRISALKFSTSVVNYTTLMAILRLFACKDLLQADINSCKTDVYTYVCIHTFILFRKNMQYNVRSEKM